MDDILTTAGLASHRNNAGEIEITEDDIDFDVEHDGDYDGYGYEVSDDGAGPGGARPGGGADEERSPTVVRPAKGLEDETF